MAGSASSYRSEGAECNQVFDVSPDDFATKSMNGISAMMSYADNVDAYEAYGFLAAGTFANRHTAIFSLQPRNSIQPVLSDGTLLVLKLQKMGGKGADSACWLECK